jgi:galactokinase
MDIDRLAEQFESRFSRPCEGIARAPGRVNLIGEHTDYNDGFVLPIAIERHTLAAFAARGDSLCTFVSVQADEEGMVDLGQPVSPGKPAWANYPKGVLAGLTAALGPLKGADILFTSDVPLGGGLSSSASLEVATAKALLAAAGQEMEDYQLARLCQRAEHEFAGAPCGIMDQSISIMGRKDHALLLDCRSGEVRQIPFDDPSLVLLVVNTRVQHGIADGAYAQRRTQCQEAADKLTLPSLRDADTEMIRSAEADGTLSGAHLKRARHVVGEIARTLDAVEALEKGSYHAFGELMYASHASLRDDYEVSCDELDAVVELARGRDGVYGARMTGGGFGGCAIVLAVAQQADGISGHIASGFARRFGHEPEMFTTRAADGASIVA